MISTDSGTKQERELALKGPCVVTVPALTVHGFGFSPDVDGTVVTVVEQHLQQLLAREAGLAGQVMRLRCEQLPRATPVAQQVRALRDEYACSAAWRALAIDAALLSLVLALARALGHGAEAQERPADRAVVHVQRFRTLVDRRYREHAALADYADALGITPTQLNRVCGRVLGRTALAVVHERLVLEAQRELAYTTLSVKQIALGLGFADAGYFTRFFQRETGRTPTAWRSLGQPDNGGHEHP